MATGVTFPNRVAGPAPDETRARGAMPKVKVVGMRSRGVVSQPEDRHRSREGGVPFLLERDILKVENVDEVPWDFKWERKRYRVAPGETGLVPFPAVVLALGDPRSAPNEQIKFRTETGETGIIPTRYESLVTLFARYGVLDYDLSDLVNFAPKVIVRHMETEQIITFPAQDPECASWPVPMHHAPGREPTGDKAAILEVQQENAHLRSELAELREMVTQRLGGAAEATRAADAVGQQGPPPGPPGAMDPLAAALLGGQTGGATPDPGPAGTFH